MSTEDLVAPYWLAIPHARGHNMVPDPPGMSLDDIRNYVGSDPEGMKIAKRWTCKLCNATAVKGYGEAYGNAYNLTRCVRYGAASGWSNMPDWPGTFPSVIDNPSLRELMRQTLLDRIQYTSDEMEAKLDSLVISVHEAIAFDRVGFGQR